MAMLSIPDEFIKRLQAAERACDARELAALFTEDAELVNMTSQLARASKGAGAGHAAASQTTPTLISPLQFWRQYLLAVETIESRFTRVADTGTMAVLEWHSTGTLPMGLPIDYNGVSILEYKDGKIHKFRTYYDSAAFLRHHPHASRSEKTMSESVGMPEITNQATS